MSLLTVLLICAPILGILYLIYDFFKHAKVAKAITRTAMRAAKQKDRHERPPATEANTKISLFFNHLNITQIFSQRSTTIDHRRLSMRFSLAVGLYFSL